MPAMRILVAEDEQTIAWLVAQVLTAMGHSVTGVASCSDAIAHLQGDGFDLVLLDLHLADGDGYRVVEALRHMQQPHTRVVIMTGERYPEDDPRAGLVAGILQKPFDIADLERTVTAFGA